MQREAMNTPMTRRDLLATLPAALAYADSVGSAAGLLVHDGVVVTSRGRVDHHANVASVAKALQGTLVGMAVARGEIDLDLVDQGAPVTASTNKTSDSTSPA